MDKIFSLLEQNPTLSIILIFVLLVFIIFLFKDTIVLYIKNKYNLYSEEEVKEVVWQLPLKEVISGAEISKTLTTMRDGRSKK